MSWIIRNLKISRGSFQLGPLSIEIPPGTSFAILGKNGAGKSSLLKAVCGRLNLAGGEVLPAEGPWATVGLEPLLISSWTVMENFQFYSQLVPDDFRTNEVPIAISRWANRPISELSQGMRRRVEVEVAMTHQFKYFLLDEVLAPLDAENRLYVGQLVQQAKARGATILLTSHQEPPPEIPCEGSLRL